MDSNRLRAALGLRGVGGKFGFHREVAGSPHVRLKNPAGEKVALYAKFRSFLDASRLVTMGISSLKLPHPLRGLLTQL